VPKATLEALLEPAGLDAATRSRMARYGTLVLQANRRFNLTGAKSDEELAGHLLDSLTVLPWIKEPYVDVGAGAGLPSIPVSIAAGVSVTMVEATAKKARFLAEAIEQLGLRAEIIAQRAETAAHLPALRERFASGTARALGSAPTTAELLLPFVSVGGIAILQRGELPPEERLALEDAALILGAQLEDERGLEATKRLMVVRKLTPTAARFPRRIGVPHKRPLCS
jgi:16S rRNA (guanine527-N7)-methyltransferase